MRKLLIVAAGIVLIAGLYINFKKQTQPPKQYLVNSKDLNKPSPKPEKNATVEAIFENEILKLGGKWAIVVKDLKSDQTYQFNQDETFASASLYKLAVMWAVFDAKMENDETIRRQLDSMITISDNDSAIALSEKLGWTNITKLMQKERLMGFNLSTENPTVTAQSTSDLLKRIWAKTAVSKGASDQMQNLLFAQKINDRIPKYLPKDVKVGHKTGELESLRHDAGIVKGKKGQYIFVFLSDTNTPSDAAETIALLSKKLFDALEQP